MKLDQETLVEEKKMAKYSKTAEFKRIREHFEDRITFWQVMLPDGREVGDRIPTPEEWLIANELIKEFRLVIQMYETSAEVVEADAKGKL